MREVNKMNLYKELEKLPTACISDASGGLNNMDIKIKPLEESYKVCGPALTVKLAPNDNKAVLWAIRDAKPGEVLVVDTKETSYNTIAGDFVVGMAQKMELAGIVTNGTIRDIQGIKELKYPVFCIGTTIAAGGKGGKGEIRVPISCGGVTIQPGDWIIGDADGVTVVPKEKLEETILVAKEKEKVDIDRARKILTSKEEICKYLDLMFDD